VLLAASLQEPVLSQAIDAHLAQQVGRLKDKMKAQVQLANRAVQEQARLFNPIVSQLVGVLLVQAVNSNKQAVVMENRNAIVKVALELFQCVVVRMVCLFFARVH
jgi:hypothetical protein